MTFLFSMCPRVSVNNLPVFLQDARPLSDAAKVHISRTLKSKPHFYFNAVQRSYSDVDVIVH